VVMEYTGRALVPTASVGFVCAWTPDTKTDSESTSTSACAETRDIVHFGTRAT
jgi:hypothetical protein